MSGISSCIDVIELINLKLGVMSRVELWDALERARHS